MQANELKQQFEPKPLGTPLTYERQLCQARYSPCGRFLVASGYDATIQRWDLSQDPPAKLPQLTAHNGWVQCQAFAPSGERLFTADSWGKICCWNYTEPEPRLVWSVESAHDGWIRALAVCPDGRSIATGGNDSVIRHWSADSGQPLSAAPHPGKVFSLAFHPRDKTLASGDLTGIVRQWSPDSKTVVREIDARVLYQRHNNQECGGVRQIVFAADGSQLVCVGQKSPEGGFATGLPCALVFDWSTGKLTQEMQVGTKDDGFAYDAQFHPAGFVMATSCAFPGKGHVWFWKPGEPQAFYLSNTIPNGRSLSLHPDGKSLALLVSLSANGNGRQLVNGQYDGGSARIHILGFSKPA